jgi:hypothetical protein
MSKQPQRCWLCEFSDDPLAKGLTRYMTEQSITMGPELLAERVHETLVETCPSAEGIGLPEVQEHIGTHMLQPGVRVACVMRSLLKLVTKLEGTIMSVDPDTGETVVDSKALSAYLKGISEVMTTYRTGEVSRLMFASSDSSK